MSLHSHKVHIPEYNRWLSDFFVLQNKKPMLLCSNSSGRMMLANSEFHLEDDDHLMLCMHQVGNYYSLTAKLLMNYTLSSP